MSPHTNTILALLGFVICLVITTPSLADHTIQPDWCNLLYGKGYCTCEWVHDTANGERQTHMLCLPAEAPLQEQCAPQRDADSKERSDPTAEEKNKTDSLIGNKDKKVHDIIQSALDVMHTGTVTERINKAWEVVSYQRNQEGRCDEFHAAADHYFTARWAVAKLGPAGMLTTAAVCTGYESLKALSELVGKELGRTGNCPVSKASWWDFLWMMAGRQDGWDDWRGLTSASKLSAPNQPVHKPLGP